MALWHSLVLGLVEGITEFLPISSTAHLALTSKLLGMSQTEFIKSFEIIIQFGAILAVLVLYGKTLIKNPLWIKKIIIAFIPTGIIGFVLYKIIKGFLLSSYGVMVWTLLIGGIALIVFELMHKEKEGAKEDISNLSVKNCLIIGVFQALAVIPGVSRAAATIVGGLLLGIKRKTIVEFSFLLAVPTMLAAGGYDLLKSGASFSGNDYSALAIGFVVSFIVAIFAIKFLLGFVRKNNFISFGVYRIVLAIIFILFLL